MTLMATALAALGRSVPRVRRFVTELEAIDVRSLPRQHRIAAIGAVYALALASLLYLRPHSWESIAGAEIVFEGQAVDRLVWVALFIGVAIAAAAFTWGLLHQAWWLTTVGMVVVTAGLLAAVNLVSSPAVQVLRNEVSGSSAGAIAGLIVLAGAALRLTWVVLLVMTVIRHPLRRTSRFRNVAALMAGIAGLFPALAFMATLGLDSGVIASGTASQNASQYLRSEVVAMPMALFAGGGYFVTLLAGIQMREAVHATVNMTSQLTSHIAARRRALRVLAAGLIAYWSVFLFDRLPSSVGRIDAFQVDQDGIWLATAVSGAVLAGLARMAHRSASGITTPIVLLLVALYGAYGIVEFALFTIGGIAVGSAPQLTWTTPIPVDLNTIAIGAGAVAGAVATWCLFRGQRANAALLYAYLVMVAPGLANRMLDNPLPIPTPVHLAAVAAALAAIGAFLYWDRLTVQNRAAASVVLVSMTVVLVASPAVAHIIDGRLFGVGIVLAFGYRYILRASTLNAAAKNNPAVIALSVGGAALVALLGWSVVAFTERFDAGGEAQTFWTGATSFSLSSVAIPLVVVAAGRAVLHGRGLE